MSESFNHLPSLKIMQHTYRTSRPVDC
uniref:Uncharacterized protein n=1 Tax=Arundo donax TaxID=35708 RepID=A0A0A9C7B6_ARUDO